MQMPARVSGKVEAGFPAQPGAARDEWKAGSAGNARVQGSEMRGSALHSITQRVQRVPLVIVVILCAMGAGCAGSCPVMTVNFGENWAST